MNVSAGSFTNLDGTRRTGDDEDYLSRCLRKHFYVFIIRHLAITMYIKIARPSIAKRIEGDIHRSFTQVTSAIMTC